MPDDMRLRRSALRMAVLDCILDCKLLPETLGALPREDHGEVAAAYDELMLARDGRLGTQKGGTHGLLAERMRQLRQPLLSRPKQGLTVRELAERAGVDRETLACALEHHGYLEMVPFGGPNRRRLVTLAAQKAGLGHNPDGSRRHIARLEGRGRASVFPVFYPEYVDSILWTLDFPRIRSAAKAISKKRARLAWLMEHHGYLPNKTIANLAEYSEIGVKVARLRLAEKVYLCVIEPFLGSEADTVSLAAR